MAKRHRTDKLTTKHTIIGDYRKVLLDIAELDVVDSIITGVISHNKTHHSGLTFQYMTETGIKLLAKTPQAVQEIFIVTKHKESLLDLLRGYGLIGEQEEASDPLANEELEKFKVKQKPQGKSANQRGPQSFGKKNSAASKLEIQKHSDDTALSLSDYLSPELLQKLNATKEQLEEQNPIQIKDDKNKSAIGNKRKQGSSANSGRKQIIDDEDMSMEELFNPKDETESFAELFGKSTMDWKKFKK